MDPMLGYVTPAAVVELTKLAAGVQPFPAQWTWNDSAVLHQPRAATTEDALSPKIEQYRNGTLIATWTSFASNPTAIPPSGPSSQHHSSEPAYLSAAAAAGMGPFGNVPHLDNYRMWQDGDVFFVYPAVYVGLNNHVVLMKKPDYYGDPIPHPPKNITIQGVTQNGIRPILYRNSAGGPQDFASSQGPLYLLGAENFTWENIDVAKGPQGIVGKAGVYINGISGTTTLRDTRIHNFADTSIQIYGQNGIIGSNGNNRGTLLLDRVELFNNGGPDGPAHNIYLGHGADSAWTLHMRNCWSHDSVTGHLVKSRAQNAILEGCYFQGRMPGGIWPSAVNSQADNWGVDIPNGGNLVIRNCIFTKNHSGNGTNGGAVTFGVEGIDLNRPHSIDIQHNTFVAFAATYDSQGHPVWPFVFSHFAIPQGNQVSFPWALPTPVPVNIAYNAFIGYLPKPIGSFMNYRGDHSLTAAFSEMTSNFSMTGKSASNAVILNTPAYAHVTQGGKVRRTTAVGAVD